MKAMIGLCIGLSILIYFVIRAERRAIRGHWIDCSKGELCPVIVRQLGPWVRGDQVFSGGNAAYSGWYSGSVVWLTRRDYGREHLVAQGFPATLVATIAGSAVATLRLVLDSTGRELSGIYQPVRVEFQLEPPRVTSRRAVAAQPRCWIRS